MKEAKVYKITAKQEPFQVKWKIVGKDGIIYNKSRWWGNIEEILTRMYGKSGEDSKLQKSIRVTDCSPKEATVLCAPWGYSIIRCMFGRDRYTIEEIQ